MMNFKIDDHSCNVDFVFIHVSYDLSSLSIIAIQWSPHSTTLHVTVVGDRDNTILKNMQMLQNCKREILIS